MAVVFPPPAALVERYVNHEESSKIFWEATARLQRRTVKLERCQHFKESNNPSWEAMVAGDFERSIELIEENRATQERQQKPFDDVGAPFYRVRVVQYPLTNYMKWELAHFRMLNVDHGETISVVDTARIADIELETNLKDFVLFDEFLMQALDYAPDGVLRGVYIVTDVDYLKEVAALANELLARSWPFEEFDFEPLVPSREPDD